MCDGRYACLFSCVVLSLDRIMIIRKAGKRRDVVCWNDCGRLQEGRVFQPLRFVLVETTVFFSCLVFSLLCSLEEMMMKACFADSYYALPIRKPNDDDDSCTNRNDNSPL